MRAFLAIVAVSVVLLGAAVGAAQIADHLVSAPISMSVRSAISRW